MGSDFRTTLRRVGVALALIGLLGVGVLGCGGGSPSSVGTTGGRAKFRPMSEGGLEEAKEEANEGIEEAKE